jgi:hypothetical protein
VTQLQDEIASKNLEDKASYFRVHSNKIMKLPHIYTLTTFNFECMPGIVSEENFDFVVCYCISMKSLAAGITLWSQIQLTQPTPINLKRV